MHLKQWQCIASHYSKWLNDIATYSLTMELILYEIKVAVAYKSCLGIPLAGKTKILIRLIQHFVHNFRYWYQQIYRLFQC